MAWGRKSYLGHAEMSSLCILSLKDWGRRVSLTFHRVVSEVDPWNDYFMRKRLGAKMKRFLRSSASC